jgi:hypothetical protein
MIGLGPGWWYSIHLFELFPELINFSDFIHRELRSNNCRKSICVFCAQRGRESNYGGRRQIIGLNLDIPNCKCKLGTKF